MSPKSSVFSAASLPRARQPGRPVCHKGHYDTLRKRLTATVGSELDVPGQEFIDTLGRVIGDAGDEARRYASGSRPLSLAVSMMV